jgi:hypothetical protein
MQENQMVKAWKEKLLEPFQISNSLFAIFAPHCFVIAELSSLTALIPSSCLLSLF